MKFILKMIRAWNRKTAPQESVVVNKPSLIRFISKEIFTYIKSMLTKQ
jgi:hypothetical protein